MYEKMKKDLKTLMIFGQMKSPILLMQMKKKKMKMIPNLIL
jgi:hypothetical protein